MNDTFAHSTIRPPSSIIQINSTFYYVKHGNALTSDLRPYNTSSNGIQSSLFLNFIVVNIINKHTVNICDEFLPSLFANYLLLCEPFTINI